MKSLDLTQPAIGSWCQVGHPANAEILAQAGFSWLAADAEHGEFEDADIAPFCRALQPYPCLPFVRVKENATLPIRRALDLGAAGVIVPLVNSAGEAERAVQAAHYPPRGIRGYAWQRGNAWGRNFDEYARAFRPVVVVMIESRAAVENIDAILAVEGVDACFIGPYDLSGSYGVTGQTSHPLIESARARIAEASCRHAKAAGQHLVTPDRTAVQRAIEQGYTFLALGMDTHFLGEGARAALAFCSQA
jgi:2-keto-3-deoxy-L-rhamnonate aldolase RhmA